MAWGLLGRVLSVRVVLAVVGEWKLGVHSSSLGREIGEEDEGEKNVVRGGQPSGRASASSLNRVHERQSTQGFARRVERIAGMSGDAHLGLRARRQHCHPYSATHSPNGSIHAATLGALMVIEGRTMTGTETSESEHR